MHHYFNSLFLKSFKIFPSSILFKFTQKAALFLIYLVFLKLDLKYVTQFNILFADCSKLRAANALILLIHYFFQLLLQQLQSDRSYRGSYVNQTIVIS